MLYRIQPLKANRRMKEKYQMANVDIQKIGNESAQPPGLLDEIEGRFEEVRRRAFEMFERRGRDLGHALDDWLKAEQETAGWPAAELAEKDGKYELQLTLPGFDPQDVQVTATPSEIIVHAGVQPEKKAGKANLLWTEFGSNDVCRRFGFPEPIDLEKTEATLDKGILHVTAAKKGAGQVKMVAVQAA